MKRLVGGQLLIDVSNHPLDTDAGEESITDADILKQLTELKSFIDGKDIKPALVKYILSSDDTIGIVNANVLYDDANKKMTIAGVSTQNGGTPLTIVINVTFTFEEFDGYVVDTATIYATYSLVVEDAAEFGDDVEIDGNLKVNSKATFEDDVTIKGSINDSNGDEAIDIGTSDVSIHKNVNIGSVSKPEDLFVSGEAQIFENIVDKDGHARFIEGDGNKGENMPAEMTFSFCKWSLSGTHLAFVVAGTITSGTTISASTFATFVVPNWIFNKIYPVFASTLIEVKTVSLRGDDWTSENLSVVLEKQTDNTIVIKVGGALTPTKDRAFRLQYDLIIDNE